jgi:putative ABC transport system ATP-binding protein
MHTTQPLLQVRCLHKTYGSKDNAAPALRNVSFDALRGEFLGIMGASGSGKTTLLNCIATVIKPTSGQILLEGSEISAFNNSQLADYRGSRIGYLFQDFELLENLTGRENIMLPLALRNTRLAETSGRIEALAALLEITEVLDSFPAQMSGGQKQRVAAARALIAQPSIVLADEPTGALDTRSARTLMEKLSAANSDTAATILMVTHDANAASFCSRILFIQDGVIFHELRRQAPQESRDGFYARILAVMAQLNGGSANVL